MAFVTLNNFDVEKASSMVVYENIFPEIQHINGKGCIDTYTKTNDVESVTYIDVMRVLPYAPRFRQLGATNNGGWHNKQNEGGYNNAPQSTHYTIPVDLIYDEGVPITNSQIYSNPIALKQVVMAQLVKVAGMSINIITYAKQLEAFFRNGDNFDKGLTHNKGQIVEGDITSAEIATSLFAFDPAQVGAHAQSPSSAFLGANASLNDGIMEIGALVVPQEERQAFVSPNLDRLLKSQYMSNASESSARILATGFINPFTQSEGVRISNSTLLCGTYDGVDMYLFNGNMRKFVYIALGVLGTSDDASLADTRAVLDKIEGFIVYGAGTCRGIVGPSVEANPNTYFGGVYILPKMKVGVEVLHGATIKCIVNGGQGATNLTATQIADVMNKVTFTAIDGNVVTGANVLTGYNTGTSN